MTITVQDLVHREVLCCLSSLVHTLATSSDDTKGELALRCEQALNLALPVTDCIEAAVQAGWERYTDHGSEDVWWRRKDGGAVYESLDQLIEGEALEPYEWEVFEHWSVSAWLADKLIAEGEKVDLDFAGLCVWARTTTGQHIAADDVMTRIHAALIGGAS